MRIWKTLTIMIIDLFMVNMAYLFAINITQLGSFTEIAGIYSKDVVVLSLIYLVCFLLYTFFILFLFINIPHLLVYHKIYIYTYT